MTERLRNSHTHLTVKNPKPS